MNAPQSREPEAGPPAGIPERTVVLFVIGLVLLYALWAIQTPGPSASPIRQNPSEPTGALSAERMPLVSGEEPLDDLFAKAGCVVCHTIPGIPAARGQVGPPLVLGTTGPLRLQDPGYQGQAKTVREYVVESVLEPRRYVAPGYPDLTMPTWYGSKLSALALEKIAAYLEQQTEAR